MLIRFFALLFGATLCLGAGPLVKIQLKNGDTLSGEWVKREGTSVQVRHPVLGLLTIPEDQLSNPGTLPSTVPPVAASTGAVSVEGKEGFFTRTGKLLKRTEGSVEFGLQNQTGRRDSSNLSLRAVADLNLGLDKFRGEVRYYYGSYQQTLTADRHDASLRWRHEFGKRFFSQVNSAYQVDHIKLIDFNYDQNLGVGWSAVNSSRHKLNLGSGATLQYRRAFNLETDTIGLAEFFEDYALRINDRLNFKQDLSLQFSPVSRTGYTLVGTQYVKGDTEASNYRFKLNTVLSGKLTSKITMNLRYEYEFDNVILDTNLKTDQRLSSSLGYTF